MSRRINSGEGKEECETEDYEKALEPSQVEEPSTKAQLASICNLCNLLGKEAEEPTTYAEAKAMIAQLSAEYNAAKQRNGSKK